jgi:hypothetical protein
LISCLKRAVLCPLSDGGIDLGRWRPSWCRRDESNVHGSPRRGLSALCLPVPPRRQVLVRQGRFALPRGCPHSALDAACLLFHHSRELVAPGRFERPCGRPRRRLRTVCLPVPPQSAMVSTGGAAPPASGMSYRRSPVELRGAINCTEIWIELRRRHSAPQMLPLHNPGYRAPLGGYDPPASRFEAECSVHLS